MLYIVAGSKCYEMPDTKISITEKLGDPSLLEMNNHLKPENIVITSNKQVKKFNNNSLEPEFIEGSDSIRLS